MLKVRFPDSVVGQGFRYSHVQTGGVFQNINLIALHETVSKHCQANNLTLNNEEFEDNVCHNTPNVVCTDGIRGLGDVIHFLAAPIAGGIDVITGSNLSGCGGCFKRQQELNQ
jgi:hypothetical protein